jgi:hypothetical protein
MALVILVQAAGVKEVDVCGGDVGHPDDEALGCGFREGDLGDA